MNSPDKSSSHRIVLDQLYQAVDALLEFDDIHGPYDDDQGQWHLGHPLNGERLRKLETIACSLAESLTFLNLEVPDWSDVEVCAGGTKHKILGLVFMEDNRLITPLGWRSRIEMLKALGAKSFAALDPSATIQPRLILEASVKPKWDYKNKVLSFRGVEANYVRNTAHNQFLFLNAFEEHGWETSIPTPGFGEPPKPDPDKANETIRALTKKHPKIRFFSTRGDSINWQSR